MADERELSAEGLDVVVDGPVLRLTLNRPEVGNALSRTAMDALRDSFAVAAESNDLRVVALTAQGKNFCTGADLTAANPPRRQDGSRPEKPRIGNLHRGINQGAHAVVEMLADLELPVVVGVRGWAAGLGSTLALLCDYIVASETTRFWTPFVQRGFTPDSGSTWLLPRLIGLPRAKEMILLGRPVEAAKALDWGMVNEVVEDGSLEDRFEAVVQEFVATATVSVGLARAMMHRHLDADLHQALRAEAFAEDVSTRSEDFKEGIASLRERRQAKYQGR